MCLRAGNRPPWSAHRSSLCCKCSRDVAQHNAPNADNISESVNPKLPRCRSRGLKLRTIATSFMMMRSFRKFLCNSDAAWMYQYRNSLKKTMHTVSVSECGRSVPTDEPHLPLLCRLLLHKLPLPLAS